MDMRDIVFLGNLVSIFMNATICYMNWKFKTWSKLNWANFGCMFGSLGMVVWMYVTI